MVRVEFEQLSVQEFLQKCKLTRIPTRPKKYLNINNIDRNLIESVITHGILTPVIVDRDYYIIDGVKRYIIVKHLVERGVKIPEPVPLLRYLDESFNEKPISILHLAYIINKFRASPEDSEFSDDVIIYMQDIAYKVWEIYNKDYEKTARHLGFSVDLVKKLIDEYIKSMSGM